MFALWEINQMERDFADPGPYPPMVLPQPTLAPFFHQSNINVSTTGLSIPAFASRVSLFKDLPVIPSPATQTHPLCPPDVPETSHSVLISPASLLLLQTLPDTHRPGFVKVLLADSSSVGAPVIPHSHGPSTMLGKSCQDCCVSRPCFISCSSQKAKDHGPFAYATRTVW